MTTARKLIDVEGHRPAPDTDAGDEPVVHVARMLTPEEIRRRAEEDLVVPEAAQRWAEENADEIREYNEHIAKHGIFGEDLRTW